MKRNLEVDRLRSLGALLIVACHLMLIYYPGMLPFEDGFGTTIIDLFFVISGYVIMASLVNQTDKLKGDNVNLVAFIKAFIVRRIFRIYPPLWAVFFLVLFFSIFLNNSDTFATPFNTIQSSLLLLTSTFNFFFIDKYYSIALAPYWSLTIEEQFYLTLPIILLLTRNNAQRVKLFIGLIFLITFVFRPLTIYYYNIEGLYFTQSRCDALIYGCLIYIMTQQPWFDNLKIKANGNRWLRMGFIVLVIYIMLGITTLGYSPAIYLPINALLASLLVVCATFDRNIIVFPAIIQKPLDFLAPRSYSLYVIHLPLILLANELFSRYDELTPELAIYKTAITLALIFIGNEILYQLVLAPALKTGKRISNAIKENAGKNIEDGNAPLTN